MGAGQNLMLDHLVKQAAITDGEVASDDQLNLPDRAVEEHVAAVFVLCLRCHSSFCE